MTREVNIFDSVAIATQTYEAHPYPIPVVRVQDAREEQAYLRRVSEDAPSTPKHDAVAAASKPPREQIEPMTQHPPEEPSEVMKQFWRDHVKQAKNGRIMARRTPTSPYVFVSVVHSSIPNEVVLQYNEKASGKTWVAAAPPEVAESYFSKLHKRRLHPGLETGYIALHNHLQPSASTREARPHATTRTTTRRTGLHA